MISRPQQLDTVDRRRMDPDQLVSRELYYAVEHTAHQGEVYRVRVKEEDGPAQDLELLYFPSTRRAGIHCDGRVMWLDAASPDSAVQRWMRGEGRCNTNRSWFPVER